MLIKFQDKGLFIMESTSGEVNLLISIFIYSKGVGLTDWTTFKQYQNEAYNKFYFKCWSFNLF